MKNLSEIEHARAESIAARAAQLVEQRHDMPQAEGANLAATGSAGQLPAYDGSGLRVRWLQCGDAINAYVLGP